MYKNTFLLLPEISRNIGTMYMGLIFSFLLLLLEVVLLVLCSLTLFSLFTSYFTGPPKRTNIVTGSVGCNTLMYVIHFQMQHVFLYGSLSSSYLGLISATSDLVIHFVCKQDTFFRFEIMHGPK